MNQILIDNIIFETTYFIIKLHTLYNNYVFTSSRIAREIIKSKNIKTTFFSKIHKKIRELLKNWADQEICVFLSQTKLGHSRKTKAVYKFTDHGIKKLKKYLAASIIFQTANNKKSYSPLFPSRNKLINKIRERILTL